MTLSHSGGIIWQKTSTSRAGLARQNITNILKQAKGDTDNISHIFDSIDDEAIERNFPFAEEAVALSKTRNAYGADDNPYKTDALAIMYAAGEKGDKTAGEEAKRVAYMSPEEFAKIEKVDDVLYVGKDGKVRIEARPELKGVKYWQEQEKNSTPAAKLLPRPELNYDADKVTQIIKENDVSFEHAKIIHYAEKWQNIPEYNWKSGDLLYWKTLGGDDFIHQEKLGFINNYKDVIKDAAEKYDIPPLLLAGVAYIEYGGKPMWIDDVAYKVRSYDWSGPDKIDSLAITNKPELTSFGNTSIQVRRAIEMLGYEETTNKKDEIIKSLKDPIQNIYLAACHLNQLRNIDFEGKSADDLTEDEIKIIASRYNIGPEPTYEAMLGSTDYGTRILNNKDDIDSALH